MRLRPRLCWRTVTIWASPRRGGNGPELTTDVIVIARRACDERSYNGREQITSVDAAILSTRKLKRQRNETSRTSHLDVDRNLGLMTTSPGPRRNVPDGWCGALVLPGAVSEAVSKLFANDSAGVRVVNRAPVAR